MFLQAAELPWKEPSKLPFNLSGLKNLGSSIDNFAEDFKVRLPQSSTFIKGFNYDACWCLHTHIAPQHVASAKCILLRRPTPHLKSIG